MHSRLKSRTGQESVEEKYGGNSWSLQYPKLDCTIGPKRQGLREVAVIQAQHTGDKGTRVWGFHHWFQIPYAVWELEIKQK